MKKFLLNVIVAALAVFGGGASAAERITVILEDNADQMRQSEKSLAYRGDPELRDAFRTLQTRLQTMLVSSGRVDVKPKTSIDKTLTQEKVYLCSYTLVQGSVLKSRPGKTDGFIIGLNLQAWNYLTETPLPELTKTVDLEISATTPETAFAYVARYLAFSTLETLSPVTVLERDGNDIRVNAGSELLKKGDVLQIREGMRKKAIAHVVETERMSVIAELTDGDLSLVKAGSQCHFVPWEPGPPPNKVPTVNIEKVKVAAASATVNTYNVQWKQFGGRINRMYNLVRTEQAIDLSGLPDKLKLQLQTVGQEAGVQWLATNPSQDPEAVDYVLDCVISGFSEEHTSGRVTDSGTLFFNQKTSLTVHFELKENKTGTVVTADDVKSVMQGMATDKRQNIEDALIANSAKQIAAKIRKAVPKR